MGDDGAAAQAAIRQASGSLDVALARSLLEEYARWLDEDLCFQGFAQELATLPGAYAPPRGRLLLAGHAGDAFGCVAYAFGCVALRPLHDGELRSVAEVKRLYVQPRGRGQRWGRRLVTQVIAEATAIGYSELKLDTLQRMSQARSLYASLGFTECDPYYHNPLGAPVYMRLSLRNAAR